MLQLKGAAGVFVSHAIRFSTSWSHARAGRRADGALSRCKAYFAIRGRIQGRSRAQAGCSTFSSKFCWIFHHTRYDYCVLFPRDIGLLEYYYGLLK